MPVTVIMCLKTIAKKWIQNQQPTATGDHRSFRVTFELQPPLQTSHLFVSFEW